MPAKRKYDWDAIVRTYLTERATNPQLGDMEFYRSQGFTSRSRQLYAAKKVGRRMHDAYASLQAKLQGKAEDLSVDAMVKLLRRMLLAAQTQYAIGAREITPQQGGPKDLQGNPIARMAPANFSEAHNAMNSGIKNVIGVSRLVVDGEEMMGIGSGVVDGVYVEHTTTLSVTELIRRVRAKRKIPHVT